MAVFQLGIATENALAICLLPIPAFKFKDREIINGFGVLVEKHY